MNNYINLTPTPGSLVESLRSIGYSVETAIADIIDNSITAKANRIDIRFEWNSGNPWIAIIDNGLGMLKDELINAMRFGSMNPLKVRGKDDLGRFGLGMKTASFSQCRHFIVISKQRKITFGGEWNLDELSESNDNRWNLGLLDESEIIDRNILNALYKEYLAKSEHGTFVLWQNLDRLIEDMPLTKREKHFNSTIDTVRKHLELVFHRFLSPDPGKNKLKILMNHDPLVAFNPFNPGSLATQELAEQKILLNNSIITVQPYILPHHNKVSRQEFKKFSGEEGYLQNQGFYVYRNRRLIIKGSWFRLIKKAELNKLIRVKVDIPNSLDHLWNIDVKKSHASPPEAIREELKKIISRIEDSGQRVYKQRGAKLSTKVQNPVWNRTIINDKVAYNINRQHPLVKEMMNFVHDDKKGLVSSMFSMIENSFPVDIFFNDIADDPLKIKNSAFDEGGLSQLLNIFIESWHNEGLSEEDFLRSILATDPFASNPDLTKTLLSKKGFISE